MGKLLFALAFFMILFSGCKKLDPKIDAPSYLEIKDYKVITDSATQGTSVQYFTDVYVSSGTQSYGYFPIPGKIPIPLEGATYLNIRPVIRVNGVKFIRVDYPVMKGSDSTLPLRRGEVLPVTPVFRYYTTAAFPLVEDFEGGIGSYDLVNSNSTDTFTTKLDTVNAAYGSQCLMMRMNSAYNVSQVQSKNGFILPTNGPNVYLEFNYKGNFQLEAGLIGSNSQGTISNPDQRSAGGVNPSATWKKMYINLTDLVRTPPYHSYYFLYFYTAKNFDPSVASPEVFIDNVKVVRQ
jgi:hypothetical protein